jgi:RNA-directed DNA polymerase
VSSLFNYYYKKVAEQSISSIANLSDVLGVTQEQINRALNLPSEARYKEVPVPKSGGGQRIALNPHKHLRLVQRRINTRILADQNTIEWPDYIFGSIPNSNVGLPDEVLRDYIHCAEVHCGAKSLLKVDVKDFYDNVHSDFVYRIFHDFLKYPQPVASVLTDICTYNGSLPQGALTSGYLACLCLYDVEPLLVKRLERKGLLYTRYIDDITISSKSLNYNFDFSKSIIEEMLLSKDLPINDKKTTVSRTSSQPLTVHGLRISFNEPRLPSTEVRNTRAAVHSIEKLAKIPGYRTTRVYRRAYARCLGRVNKLKRVGHNKHQYLIERLRKVVPLAHEDDVERVKSMISRLDNDYALKKHTYDYHQRYYRAHQRLNIIKRNFPTVAKSLRNRLKSIRSEYKL